MNNMIRTKLSVMMFLEFFIWGAWFPPSFGFFGESGLGFVHEVVNFTVSLPAALGGPFNVVLQQQDLLNFAFPISAILAMFIGNQFVDRNFAAERFLAFSQFVGGIAMLGFGVLSWMAFRSNATVPNFWLFFACMAVHCLLFVPTISVTNTIAFANLKDAQKDFGPVRLWGTIGWIAASWPFIFILVDWDKVRALGEVGFITWLGDALGTPLAGTPLNQGKSWAFLTSGIASLLLAAFSLTLPHTPPNPAKEGKNQLAWLEAMKLLKHPFLLVLFVVTFIDATVHDGFFFYAFTYLGKVGVPSNWIQPAMTVGQIAEIVTMAILGYVLKNLGWRYTMVLGILGHAARFTVFALFPEPYAAVAVNVLHGICYAFFFATLYIFVDDVFPKDARTSAQGLFNFLILGLGPITSRYLWRSLQDAYTVEKIVDGVATKEVQYNQLLLYPAGAAVAAAVLLLVLFHPPAKPVPESVGH
jgi:hypothetical protein